MVVPLILLGAAMKAAFALVLVHRTRAWWLPGCAMVAAGGVVAWHAPLRVVGLGTLLLGINAIAIARILYERASD